MDKLLAVDQFVIAGGGGFVVGCLFTLFYVWLRFR